MVCAPVRAKCVPEGVGVGPLVPANHLKRMVGVIGFEPTAPTSRTAFHLLRAAP